MQCSASFEITDEDHAFYDKVSPMFNGKKWAIPLPTHCPMCRMQHRQAWRNERSIYPNTCNSCNKPIISMYAPEKPHTMYCHTCWWGDNWDALQYGKDFDFDRSFFDQFHDLLLQVPLPALINTQAENSEYCCRIYDGRNNYLSFIALFQPENLLYTYYTMSCKDSADINLCQYCQLCYELTDAERCYNCRYGRRIRNCKDCFFIEDCIGCSDCFGCKNLHQKQFCIFNEQKTKEEYQEFLTSCTFGSADFVQNMQEKAQEFFMKLPNRAKLIINSENVSGANIFNCRDSHEIYDLYESERMRYCTQGERSHDCQDVIGVSPIEFCLEGVTLGGPSSMLCFCAAVFESSHLLYCYDCYANCHDCFGCVGLKKQQYCILNKQYSKEEYEALMPKIIEHMKQTGEWGQFFPVALSPFAYNETYALHAFPLTKQKVEALEWKWRDEEDAIPNVEKTISAHQLPDAITDVPDDVCNWAVRCQKTKRPFRVIKQELDFYRNMQISIPRTHPDERHRCRILSRNPNMLWSRNCDKCGKSIQTTYAPDRPEIVYCEECYLSEVY